MTPSLQRFLSLLCGEYSNQQQAFENPPFFAHILLRYRPIEHLQPGSLLLEQTYAVDPKNPYRLRMIRAEELETGAIKLWNHSFREPARFANATLDRRRRQEISTDDLTVLEQCHYQVIEREDGYHGEIEPGCLCIGRRDEKDTVLKSHFHLKGNTLSTLDRGYDPTTNQRCWGSIAGEFCFKRSESWDADWADAS